MKIQTEKRNYSDRPEFSSLFLAKRCHFAWWTVTPEYCSRAKTDGLLNPSSRNSKCNCLNRTRHSSLPPILLKYICSLSYKYFLCFYFEGLLFMLQIIGRVFHRLHCSKVVLLLFSSNKQTRYTYKPCIIQLFSKLHFLWTHSFSCFLFSKPFSCFPSFIFG